MILSDRDFSLNPSSWLAPSTCLDSNKSAYDLALSLVRPFGFISSVGELLDPLLPILSFPPLSLSATLSLLLTRRSLTYRFRVDQASTPLPPSYPALKPTISTSAALSVAVPFDPPSPKLSRSFVETRISSSLSLEQRRAADSFRIGWI